MGRVWLIAALASALCLVLPYRYLAAVAVAVVLAYAAGFSVRGRIVLDAHEVAVRGAVQEDRVPTDGGIEVDQARFAMEGILLGLLPMLTTRVMYGNRMRARFTPFFWHDTAPLVAEIRRRAEGSDG